MMRLALALLIGVAHADSSAPARSLFGPELMCSQPELADLQGMSAAQYERQTLLRFRKHKVFPLWKAAFAFRRSGKMASAVMIDEPEQAPRPMSFGELQPPPVVGLPSRCSQGCCDLMFQDAPRWVRRICFDDDDRVNFVSVVATSPADPLPMEAVTLPPKTPEDQERRRQLEEHPELALERLEEEARRHPHGRWQRDACTPMLYAHSADTVLFCLLYLPDGCEQMRPLLDQYFWGQRQGELSAPGLARLKLAMARDPQLRRLSQLAQTAGTPKSRNETRWWKENQHQYVSVAPGVLPKGRYWPMLLDGCRGSCCRYLQDGATPCIADPPISMVFRICFDDQDQPTDVWSAVDTEADDCPPDER